MSSRVDRLTLAELDEGSRRLKTDLLAVIGSDDHPERWKALGIAAWLCERRAKPDAKVEDYMAMLPNDVFVLLDLTNDEEEAAGDDEGPTDSAPE